MRYRVKLQPAGSPTSPTLIDYDSLFSKREHFFYNGSHSEYLPSPLSEYDETPGTWNVFTPVHIMHILTAKISGVDLFRYYSVYESAEGAINLTQCTFNTRDFDC